MDQDTADKIYPIKVSRQENDRAIIVWKHMIRALQSLPDLCCAYDQGGYPPWYDYLD